ncbi:dihydrolipoyl dehydrogenase family protein [Mycolicibacterium sediminis]|uniref:Pyridine nucleotide-disulfide oxidoreductase n=1 Tax=Mycolicibacterium sediminis TaxID=1286180 RepID=A0A7I7QVD5_9MYCO|nr:NAD(P)/FAD-dependent oxidoreductase [Mycolicibacterium sediminis]BBY30329.1 pyridine nucleotide-disulfide oxidoreductase [Mycolicibacterium sediminis]
MTTSTKEHTNDFDVVILGGGAGAKLIWGAVGDRSVAVVERSRVGGACPFVACVPSKPMLRTARVWQLGADTQQPALFTGRVPAAEAYRLACERRDAIVHHRDDILNAEALERTGAVLVRGHGQLREPGVLDVDGRTLRYRELVINTGSRSRRPDIPGLESAPTWTSDDALSATELPSSMLILGGGAVGCELAFLFATFGTAVTLVQRGSRLLPDEEPRASATVEQALAELGVTIHTDATVTGVASQGDRTRAQLSSGPRITVERIVLAAGRLPNSAGLGLSNVGLQLDDHAPIPVDDHCRVVGFEHLWAIGDVTGKSAFTHTAHYQGRVVASNLRGHSIRANYAAIPRAVYVEPTLASVGHTWATARHAGIEPISASVEMRTAAVRSITDGQSAGWVTLLADPQSGRLIGATGMGQNAEEWIVTVSLAIRASSPISLLADVVHPFPSFGEVLENPLWQLREALHDVQGSPHGPDDDRSRCDS